MKTQMGIGMKSGGRLKRKSSGSSSHKLSISTPLSVKTTSATSSSSVVTHASLWGNLQKRFVRTLFEKYLEGLTSAKPYYRNNRAICWFKGLKGVRKNAIYKRLKEVDYEGCEVLKAKIRSMAVHANSLKRHKFVPTNKEVAQQSVLVEQEQLVTGNASILRFVPLGGMQKALSLVRAAGYSPDETAAIFNMKPEDVNSLATVEAIRAARREVPEAVRAAADGYVLRDLMAGNVSANTEIADRISARRTKLVLDMSAEQRALTKEDKVVEDQREDDLASRFGVDRKKGEVIEVKAVKERKVK